MSMENDDQKAFWERFSDVWVKQQTELDGLMAPVLTRVLEHASLTAGMSVLDIGCGTGTSTLIAAQAVGPDGHALGVDISEPMLERARTTAGATKNAEFETADAADFPFTEAAYDAVISRFGVMFFADPVKAFANILRGMKSGAKVTMATWSHLDSNPWFQAPMYAAKRRLGAPPPLDPNAPGPLAFRDIDRVCGILAAAGFAAPQGSAEHLHFTPPGDLQDVARHACTIGPAARTMEYFEGTEADLDAIARDVEQAFEPYSTKSGVLVPAEINFFSATAP